MKQEYEFVHVQKHFWQSKFLKLIYHVCNTFMKLCRPSGCKFLIEKISVALCERLGESHGIKERPILVELKLFLQKDVKTGYIL